MVTIGLVGEAPDRHHHLTPPRHDCTPGSQCGVGGAFVMFSTDRLATLRARLLRLEGLHCIILELGGAGFTDGNRISDSNGDPETFTRLGVSGILPGGDRDKQGQK